MSRRDPDAPRYLALTHDPLRTDPGLCALPFALQGLEIALRRDGTRSACGVSHLRLGPWTRLGPALTRQIVEDGLRALVDAGRCVVDWDEEEVYWHGYLRDQRGLGSYRYAQGVLNAVAAIQSPAIRAVVTSEMAAISLAKVATPTSDPRFAAAADRTRDAWQSLVSDCITTSDGVSDGVSDGASIPVHSPQSTGHSSQSTGSSSSAREPVDITASTPDSSTSHHHGKAREVSGDRKSTALALIESEPKAKSGNDAKALVDGWWPEYGSQSSTGRDNIEAAVAQLLDEGRPADVVIAALVHCVTVENYGVTAGSLRTAAIKVAKQQSPALSRFQADTEAMFAVAAAMEGRTA